MTSWTAVSYNPLSLKGPNRLASIVKEIKWYSFIGLVSTQTRTSTAVERFTSNSHIVFQWGRRADDPAAGVALAVRSTLFQERNISKIFTPPEEFQGRVGAVRLRHGDADFCVITAYIPVEPHKQAEKEYNARLWRWIGHMLDQLPSRCLPVLLLDANGRVGNHTNEAVGVCEPQRQNNNGSLLVQCLEQHFLFAINTVYCCGPTFHGQFGNNSRVDCVCLPQSKRDCIQECKILHPAGDRLQYISAAAAGKRDHRPLPVRFRHTLAYARLDSTSKRDRDALAAGVLRGLHREEFLQKVEEACCSLEMLLHRARLAPSGTTSTGWYWKRAQVCMV